MSEAKIIARLVDAAEQARSSGGWQPVSTAPKDGRIILGYGRLAGEVFGPSDGEVIAPILWRGGRTDYDGFAWRMPYGDACAVWMAPTHWMPLPDPP